MSRLEKANLQKKKLKAQKKFVKTMYPDKTLKEKVQLAIWDFKHGQYPKCKYKQLEQLFTDRLKETDIKEEEEWEIKQILLKLI